MHSTIDARAAFEFCTKFIEANNTDGFSNILHDNVKNQSDDWFYIEDEVSEDSLNHLYRIFTKWFVVEVTSSIDLEDFDYTSTKSTYGTWTRNFEARDITSDYTSYKHAQLSKATQIDSHLSKLYLNNL